MNACPNCGKELGPDAVHGLCPACLLQAGLGTGVRAVATTVASATFATPTGSAEPLTREAIAEKFPQLEILELLGRGGMGVVYKARQPQLDRLVALKILPAEIARTPGFAERFAREARALARLSHPHIVTIHDSDQAGGLYYFIMEYVDGANLRQLIADKKLSPETALAIVPKICEALQFAHDEGILHRDIKPENILLDKKGRVKIADFGLAKLTGADDLDHGLTHTGAAMGTPRYMAPEQFNDTKGVDHRADIYSLGVVFYEMLTGQLPIGRFPLPSKTLHVDVRLDEVVLRTLEQEPALRYQHASEVKTDVENITLHGGRARVAAPSAAHVEERSVASPAVPAIAPELRAKINSAGILMTIAGVAVALSGLIAFLYGAAMAFHHASTVTNPSDNVAARAAGGAFEMVLITLCGIAVLVSGQGMRKLRFRSFALAASVMLLALPLVLLATFGLSQLEWVFFQLIFGVYVGFTAFTLLRKPEVEAAFNAAAEVPTTETSAAANFQSSEPRLSMCALIGVLWATLGSVASASFLIHLVDGLRQNMNFPDTFIVLCILVPALTVVGAMLLGGVAIGQIKRSDGKTYGLPLAATSLLAHPVFALGTVVWWATHLAQFAIWTQANPPDLHGELPPSAAPGMTFWILNTIFSLAACFFASRAAWRKIAGVQSVVTAEDSVRRAAVGLLLSGVTSLIATFVYTMLFLENRPGMWSTVGYIARVAGLLCLAGLSGVVLQGALKMMHLENFPASRRSALCSLFSLASPVSIPAGIYALVVLARPESKGLFTSTPRIAPGTPTSTDHPVHTAGTIARPSWFDAQAARRRWIALSLMLGLFALGLGALFMRGPTPNSGLAVITEDTSANEGATSPVHRMFRYNASAPADHRASFWVEYWRDGKLDKKVGLTGGQMRQLPSRAAFEGGFDFSLADGAKTSPDAAGKVRWDFNVSSRLRDWTSSNGVMKVNDDASRGGHGDWIADPFAGLAVVSTWGKTGKWKVAIGEPVTVLVLRGYATGENLSAGLNDQDAKQGKACILLRARFDAVPPDERVEHSQSKSLIAADVEKLGVPAPKPVVGIKAAMVREDAGGVTTNKLFRDFRYSVTAPVNTRATFWVELWRDGELDQQPGATGGQSYEPPVGGNFDGPFIFSVADAAEWGPGAAGQLIWDFMAATPLFDGADAVKNTKFRPVRSDALGAQRTWIGNAFEGLEVRNSWGGKRTWEVPGGQPVTLLVIRGDPPSPADRADLGEASAKQAKACLLLKVRFDFVRPGDLKSASVTKYLDANAIDPRVEKPAAATATDPRFVIAQDRAKIPAAKTAGREEYAFTLSAPTGHVLNVWAEIWQEGRMSILGGLDYHLAPRGGQRIDTKFALATQDGNVASVESKGMMRFDWGFDGAWNNSQWSTNLFKGMGAVHCSWDREPRQWNPRPGDVVTFLSITGYTISEFRSAMSVFTEADLIKGWPNAAILIRAQFTPALPGEICDGQGPSVGTNGLLNRIGGERLPFAQFEIAKQLNADVSRCASPAEAHAVLVAAASTREGQKRAVEMIGAFLENVGYSTANPDKRIVIEPISALWWRARKGQTVEAEALVTALERFIDDLNTGARGVWWDRPEPIVKGENGPRLSPATASILKLTPAQVAEANAVLQNYAKEARALERRHTKITKNDQGHVLVNIGRYSPECLGLASNLVAELGGIVPQKLLPAIQVGGLPAAIFGCAGECAQEIEMWKEDGKYNLTHRQYDWIPVPGQFRNSNSFSNVGPGIETFYGDYRLYWTEE